jgi:hypothetical protein
MYLQKKRKIEASFRMETLICDVLPSFRIAMIKTMKGGKSYFKIDARRTKPSCKRI